jgi:hypothetical protein
MTHSQLSGCHDHPFSDLETESSIQVQFVTKVAKSNKDGWIDVRSKGVQGERRMSEDGVGCVGLSEMERGY